MAWREERQFHGWDTHGWYLRDEHHIVVSERYSPWQLLYLADALAEWNATVLLRQVSEYRNDGPEILARQQAASAARLRFLDEEWRPAIKLLVALQPRLWPYRRGKTTLLYDPEVGERVDQLQLAAKTFDPQATERRRPVC